MSITHRHLATALLHILTTKGREALPRLLHTGIDEFDSIAVISVIVTIVERSTRDTSVNSVSIISYLVDRNAHKLRSYLHRSDTIVRSVSRLLELDR